MFNQRDTKKKTRLIVTMADFTINKCSLNANKLKFLRIPNETNKKEQFLT